MRIRLNSTAVEVRNVAHGIEVAYVSGGKITRVGARDGVLACYQAMIPYIAPETGAEQRAALHENVRAPLVYVTVAVRNWQPWHKLGVAYIQNPGGTYAAYLDFPDGVVLTPAFMKQMAAAPAASRHHELAWIWKRLGNAKLGIVEQCAFRPVQIASTQRPDRRPAHAANRSC